MWLWFYDNMVGMQNAIFSSDTNGADDIGYRVKYKAHANAVLVKLGTKLILQRVEIFVDTGSWVHIAFTWHSADILRVYANGCTAGLALVNQSTLRFEEGEFLVGGTGGRWSTAEMKIDDLLVWYKELTHAQIWYIFEYGL